MAGHSPPFGENARGGNHAVKVVGIGLAPHEDNRVTILGVLHGTVGIKDHPAHGSSRRGGKPRRQNIDWGSGVDSRVEQLVELIGIHPTHGFLLCDE